MSKWEHSSSTSTLSPTDEGRKFRFPLPRSGVLESSLPCAGSAGSSSSSSLSSPRCSGGASAGTRNPGQVPARWRLGQAFVLQRLVAGTWPDQVDPDRVHQVVADRIVVGCRRLLSSGHRALLRLALVPADASRASFSSRARSRFSARRRMRTSSRTSSGHRYRQGFFVRPDPSSSTS